MASGLNKERTLFLVGTALFVWVMLKSGLYWRRELEKPGAPKVPAVATQRGDPDIRSKLEVPSLAYYTERGPRDPFFPDASHPAGFYVRSTASHTFYSPSRSTQCYVRSRYSFDCRMTPVPVLEVRFLIPEGTTVTQVYSKEIDPKRLHGSQGRVYVVPVRPAAEKRTYYRCLITLTTQGTLDLPGKWSAPVITCTGAMPKVQSESGHLALAAPGKRVELAPAS
ncbi:hypothetical protein HQ576_14905, partial [bacterium]|nr:hypothetical protein [bacterium]